VGDGSDRFDVEHVAAWVANSLGKECLGVRLDRSTPGTRIVRIHKTQFDREFAKEVLKLCDGAAV